MTRGAIKLTRKIRHHIQTAVDAVPRRHDIASRPARAVSAAIHNCIKCLAYRLRPTNAVVYFRRQRPTNAARNTRDRQTSVHQRTSQSLTMCAVIDDGRHAASKVLSLRRRGIASVPARCGDGICESV